MYVRAVRCKVSGAGFLVSLHSALSISWCADARYATNCLTTTHCARAGKSAPGSPVRMERDPHTKRPGSATPQRSVRWDPPQVRTFETSRPSSSTSDVDIDRHASSSSSSS